MSAMTALAAPGTPTALMSPQPGHLPSWPMSVKKGSTLEDTILGVWEDLERRGRSSCPVCGGTDLTSRGCGDCGSVLA